MRRFTQLSALALAASLIGTAAFAQTGHAADTKSGTADKSDKTAAAATPADSDPIVASVNDMKIHLSDIQAAAQRLPAQMQQMPPDKLFPLLVNQEIDRDALLVEAKKANLEQDPKVAEAMQKAANIQLENAYVQQHIAAAVTPTAVQAAYDQQYAGKPGPEQVKAKQILVKTKAEADAIIAKLNKGAKFDVLAKKDSIDPGASNGGELGWFSADEMVPEFSKAAFALKPGQYTKTPVHSQFGWHVILSEGKRQGPTPKLADVEGQLRQQLADNAIQKTLDDVRKQVTVKVYDADGKPGAQTEGQPAAGDNGDKTGKAATGKDAKTK
ncbi:MAG: peptidylprolyl isomerase [Rhodospirillales bacterium 20-64-7]|nr:MAG: peptidylprolyl isomerase [Rhodospirillales bacterium 20-64-7]